MKTLAIIFAFIFTSAGPGDELRLVSWLIVPASTLSIEGASNVNNFTCGMDNYDQTDTLVVIENTPKQIVFSPNQLAIPVDGFNCRNNLITRDFRETLQAEDHPAIGVSFLSFKKIPSSRAEKSSYDASVVIELAGRKRSVQIQFDFFEKSYSQYYLTGSKVLRFSDFGFSPPTKAMGLIKVQDELTINFNLVMTPL